MGYAGVYGRQQNPSSQQTLISVDMQQVSFSEFIEEIEKQTGFLFYYDPVFVEGLQISVQVSQKRLDQILEAVLKPNDLFFSIDDYKRVFITTFARILTHLPVDSVFNDSTGTREKSASRVQVSNRLIGDYVDSVRSKNLSAIENKIFQFGDPYSAKPGTKMLTGYLKSINTGEPISQATLKVVGQNVNVQPDQNGFFRVPITTEHATLTVSSVGKSETQRQLLMYSDGRLDIELDDIVYSLNEVVVSVEQGVNVRRVSMGIEKINAQTLKQAPAVLGEADVIRVILTLPGVQTVGESTTGFNVRGGATDQNLVYFNDATVFNPSHFFGFFSGFNADVINTAELYKSSIPARYGGRLSSVLDITAKSGTKNKVSGSGGIGLLTGRFMLEGPIGAATTFVVGGRSTYSDWLLNLIPAENYKNSSAGFYDGNILVSHQLNEKNAIYLTGYHSSDHFSLRTDTTYQYKNSNFNIKWNRIHSSKVYSVLTLGYDRYANGIEGRGNELHAFDWDYALGQTFGKLDIFHRVNELHNLNYGIQSQYIQNSPGRLSPQGPESILTPGLLEKEQALESAIYFSDQFDISEKLGLDLGVRLGMFNYLGPHTKRVYPEEAPRFVGGHSSEEYIGSGSIIHTYFAPEFRLGLRYTLSPDNSIKLGYNSLRQNIHMLSNTTAISPTDTWKLSDHTIKPQSGDQLAVGYYHDFDNNRIAMSMEAYYKRIDNYLDYKSGAKLLMNSHIETDVIGTQARAYGFEFLIRKNVGKLNGWLSYTYSRVRQRTYSDTHVDEMINKGMFYPSNHDKPHSVNFVGNYKVTHRLSISVNSQYSTGRPITLPIGQYYFAGSYRVIYSDRNQYRIPDYFRTDVSLNIEGNHKVRKRIHSSWSVGVYNVTGRRNPFSVYFLSERGTINGYKLSVFGNQIPFVTYNFKF